MLPIAALQFRADDAFADAIKRICACSKAPGILFGETDGRRMPDLGALFVAVGVEMALLRMGADGLAAGLCTLRTGASATARIEAKYSVLGR